MRAPHGKRTTYGGVVIDEEGHVLLRRPRGEYDGYVWTFAKGAPENGETPEQTALREVRQETGIEATIVGTLPGWYESGASVTRYFVMKSVRVAGDFDHETSEVIWVSVEEAARRIGLTRNLAGKTRDHAVLEALNEYMHLKD